MKKISVFILLVVTLGLLTGCNFWENDKKTGAIIDPPQQEQDLANEYVLDLKQLNAKEAIEKSIPFEKNEKVTAGTAMVEETLYLLDENGYVVPQNVSLPKSDGPAKQVLRYLVVNGPLESEGKLPTGFFPVLPKGTEVLGMTVKEDGLATVDFSKEFLTYAPHNERAILEALTWSLTQFPTIKKVSIRVEGKPLDQLPKQKTPISSGRDRKDGINLEIAENINMQNAVPITLYFRGESSMGGASYEVPVTRMVDNEGDIVKQTLAQLISGPQGGTQLYSSILPDTKVLGVSQNGGKLVVNFSEELIKFSENAKPSNEVVQAIKRSLKEKKEVKEIIIQVNGHPIKL